MKHEHKTRDKAADISGIEKRITPVSKLAHHLSVVLYGRSGSGKTTLSCDFPGPVLLLDMNDRGTASVKEHKNLSVLTCEEWMDVEQAYWYVKKHPGKFKTIVLDTVSMMQDLALAQVINDKGGTTNGRMLTKQDWGQAAAMLKTWIVNYRDLQKDMEVVFIAQDRITGGSDEDEDEDQIMPEVGPRLMPSVASTLNASVDLIGNTFVREVIKKVKTADKKIIEKRRIEYCLRIGPHAYYTTKVRKPKAISVPAYLVDPSYEDLVATLKEDNNG